VTLPGSCSIESSIQRAPRTWTGRPGRSASAQPLLLFYDMAMNFMKSAGIKLAALGLRRIVSDSQCGFSAVIGGRVLAAAGAPLIDHAAQNRGCTRLPTRDALGSAGSGALIPRPALAASSRPSSKSS